MTVLELARGLVLFTIIGVGLFINWMIPAMPLPVAFALAAVLSPTTPSRCRPSLPGCPSRSG